MIRTLSFLLVCLCTASLLFSAEQPNQPNWTFTEEQLRLFNPPVDADAEAMLQWINPLETRTPRDTEPYGGFDKYREHVSLMQIMISRAVLATDPPFELERTAWHNLWHPYSVLARQNRDEWLPKTKAVYDELTALSRKKGEVLDQQTVFYLIYRASFLGTIFLMDRSFLPHGEGLLGEINNFMERHRDLDDLKYGLFFAKTSLLMPMGMVDSKYQQMLADFAAEMRELVSQNEDRVQSPSWFGLLSPASPYDAEKQAEAFRLIEMFQHLIDTNEETNRFDAAGIRSLYSRQVILFTPLIRYDRANIPKFQTHLDALEKKGDPQLNDVILTGYRILWMRALQDFTANGGSDDDLSLIFDAIIKFLDFADDSYDNSGWWILSRITSPLGPFDRSTPGQRAFFKFRLAQVIAKMETMEKAWKDAGRSMREESYVELLREYLTSLLTRLPLP